MIGLCIPPRNGELDAAYTAGVCARLSPPWWYDYHYGGIGHDGYVPMLFDGDVERLAECADMVFDAPHNMPERILLLNEPEQETQANMTPEQAITMLHRWWRRVPSWVVHSYVGGVNISVHHGRTPYEWLDAFVDLLGEHDFSAFRASQCQAKHPVREMQSISVKREGDYVILDLKANAFLHHMVRNIMGSLMVIGRNEQKIEWMHELLSGQDRKKAGMTASAAGLYLVNVEYPEQYGLPDSGWLPEFS